MDSKVAILISVFNSAKTIDRCFEGIQNQTFQDFQIICVNDASTDITPELLKKWSSLLKEKLIIINNRENIGLTKSLNLGLDKITTPYTARIDADDWWHPEKLEKQISFLEKKQDYDIVGCSYTNVANGKEKLILPPETNEAIQKNIIKKNPFAHSCVIFKTDLIKKAGGYDESIRYGQDYELWLRISNQTKLANLKDNLCYRNAESGISFEKQNEQMMQCLKTQIKYIKKLNRSFFEYRFILEPMLVVLTPQFIRKLKRKLL